MTARASSPTILLVPGFADGAGMFDPLQETDLAGHYALHALSLPGFAGLPPMDGVVSLQSMAAHVAEQAQRLDARILVGHSVGSIIACMAAEQSGGRIEKIVSLEGNLTAEDAYFSGSAAGYDSPEAFKPAFLARLGEMARGNAILERYRDLAERADPRSLWELGCDAHRFSREHIPGEQLIGGPRHLYIYNPDNCPQASIDWIDEHPINVRIAPGASHWISIDQPETLSAMMLEFLEP